MTEQEWQESAEPAAMLEFLGGKVNQRKRCLFDAACCVELIDLLAYPESEQAIDIVRRQADGLVRLEEFQDTRDAAERACAYVDQDTEGDDPFAPLYAARAVWTLLLDEEERLVWGVPSEVAAGALAAAEVDRTRAPNPPGWGGLARLQGTAEEREASERGQAAARRRQAHLIRDLFGNPFHPSAMQPSWRTAAVIAMAQHIYDDGLFDLLPVLADALEEAGCTDAAILSHLRGPGPHVRGCWALDLVLDRW